MDVHIVVKGDTLWKIARQYGISFEDLKRVNAHLANPDYIVPGMKIFLPAKKKEHMPSMKVPDKKPQQGKETQPVKPSKPPTQKKPETGVQTKPTKPMQPIPLPPQGETVKPQPKPPMPPKPTPPVMKPQQPEQKPPAEQAPTPPAPQLPPMAMPQFYPPVMPMPIPCGWMPIFDADCYPMVHHQEMTPPLPLPTPELPSMPMQPTPPAQMGTKPPAIDMMESSQEYDWEESPIYPGMGTGTPPSYPTSGWEMMESSHVPHMPQMESSHHMVHCPPEQGYMPQMIAPGQQHPYGMMHPQQQYYHCQPCQPVYHHGCHHHGYYPQMMMPMPMQPQQWPMQQMPMHQQPYPYYSQPDNNDCGTC
ncbi:LysM peptidoglycan-binding domain-containing protein [Sporosarcina sp. Sa2YVA2]|uniref:LysM peptidoglycan-binding domain-containing protein n=1 Tax=Sporosarcina quadrami TaxID=2762234 RepID=A0ABR8U4S7_9BACL|nr:LysM peptidoglycan-binding domain-containing protein [Sporosarcina quadrami]MBD7983049.1 LysM peptidoglycan-binding domain-containing protein [Sporosarcina quadrami]